MFLDLFSAGKVLDEMGEPSEVTLVIAGFVQNAGGDWEIPLAKGLLKGKLKVRKSVVDDNWVASYVLYYGDHELNFFNLFVSHRSYEWWESHPVYMWRVTM
jgi:hypothetical protein